ncbi:S-adenosyl-L-methionine-dependent methyltransferase [Mycena albidolilacea]|uniref:Protein arginine methyltransferase NDUFAF7 n=1 Tax=Mycena albidolilacea TaxID=1033008 RepID=A0AAD6YYA3_9AGAR|nr:S-adenosyl-L-methionine-dependent methyltransferase [Mycena albidolilacea]
MLRSCARRRIPWRGLGQKRLSSNASPPPITPVEKIIIDGIKATGPISFSTYMQMCLAHPTQGYYMNPRNPIFGAQGDFVTSPEISGIFGELLGVWLMSQWLEVVQQQQQRPPVRLIELGPGRGTLMHDILRVASQFTGMAGGQLKEVHLVETSPTLRALQEKRLAPSAEKYGCTLEWHDSLDEIAPSEEEYTMLVAHEFFDALPFHTIEKTEKGWQEILIALAESESESADTSPYPRFRYVLSPQPTAASTLLGMSSPRFDSGPAPVGTRLEVSPAAFKTMRTVGELLAPRGRGCGLIVDYGAARAFDQSFRVSYASSSSRFAFRLTRSDAFKNHAIVDVFHAPGECDLTANVDFAYLAEAVGGLVRTHGPLPQAAFLERMGLQLRVNQLVTGKSDEETARIREAGRRLADEKGMGREYRVLGIGGKPGAEELVWPFLEDIETVEPGPEQV